MCCGCLGWEHTHTKIPTMHLPNHRSTLVCCTTIRSINERNLVTRKVFCRRAFVFLFCFFPPFFGGCFVHWSSFLAGASATKRWGGGGGGGGGVVDGNDIYSYYFMCAFFFFSPFPTLVEQIQDLNS